MNPEFTNFNFYVEIHPNDQSGSIEAAFAECDGLEMSIENKVIREGGNNGRAIQLMGPVSYGELSLKRGITKDFSLWDWFEHLQAGKGRRYRADVEILLRSSNQDDPRTQTKFHLSNCLPIKLKAPGLNAQDDAVAIEEVQMLYERMHRVKEES